MFRNSVQLGGKAGQHGGKTVLLVEDSRTFTAALRAGLELLLGVSVVHCSSLAAVKVLVENDPSRFALAVLDLNLPDAPNCEALDYIISKGVPPVVFTGAFNDRTRDDIMSRNVLAYVAKHHFNAIGALIETVGRILANSATRVLVVDSDPATQNTICATLSAQQFSVLRAESGKEALAALDNHSGIHIVLTNVVLADMGGLELLADIRLLHGEDGVHVIGMAEEAHRSRAADFLRAGGDDFIHIPFQSDEFASRIARVATLHARIQALHQMAALDYLTGIFNRRHFFETGPRMVDQALRRGANTCIAIVDIDHFKRLNDTYGHEVGDIVLKAVASRLRDMVGEGNLLARLGGEEFGILFNGQDLTAAANSCEKIREDLAATKIIADDDELFVNISIGLAAVGGKESFDNYLNAADQFLYMAKHAGRNRVFSELAMLQSMAS